MISSNTFVTDGIHFKSDMSAVTTVDVDIDFQ